MNTLTSCLGVVLAGGKSSRMGQDKASLRRENQDMLSYSKSLLESAGSTQVVVSGGEYGIKDINANLGPLGGIDSVIKQFTPQALLILPVDLPLMHANELAALKRAGEVSQRACYFANHYLPLYLPVNAFVEQFFQQSLLGTAQKQGLPSNKSAKRNLSGPSVRSLLAQIPHHAITPKNQQCLFNANTPEQWQEAKKLISLQRKTHV